MRFLLFATLFLSVFIILTLYISKRFVNKLHFQTRYKKLFNIFLWFNLLGVFGYLLVRYFPVVPNFIYFLLSIPIGVIFLLFTTTLIYEFFTYCIHVGTKSNTRREFFKKSLDFGALALASGINAKAMYNAKHLEIESVTVKLKNLKKSYTLVQLSDVHIGGPIDKKFMASLVAKINAIKCDAVVITGDLIDTDIKYAKEALDELKNIQTTYGTFFVVGNHEYLHTISVLIEYLTHIGIRVLQNENVYIGNNNEGFNLVGVHDIMGYRMGQFEPDIKQALTHIQDTSPTVLLAHQPKYIKEVPQSVDLVLSGHTHGGQLFPFNFLVKLEQPYVKGLHQHNDFTQIYVSKGTGFWGPPMRLGASSEMTVLTLI